MECVCWQDVVKAVKSSKKAHILNDNVYELIYDQQFTVLAVAKSDLKGK